LNLIREANNEELIKLEKEIHNLTMSKNEYSSDLTMMREERHNILSQVEELSLELKNNRLN